MNLNPEITQKGAYNSAFISLLSGLIIFIMLVLFGYEIIDIGPIWEEWVAVTLLLLGGIIFLVFSSSLLSLLLTSIGSKRINQKISPPKILPKPISQSKRKIFYVTFFVLLVICVYLIIDSMSSKTIVPFNEGDNTFKCNRKERYPNPPEFERALSLYNQRKMEYYAKIKSDKNINIITNCIIVKYSDNEMQDNLEGYFIFDETTASDEYLPIYVNTKYKEYDDVTTSVLLSHEIAHAGQFLDAISDQDKLNCFEKEIDAYYQQLAYFYYILNREERLSVLARKNLSDNAQVRFIAMIDTQYQQYIRTCRSDSKCVYDKMAKYIEDSVYNSSVYRKQCMGKGPI